MKNNSIVADFLMDAVAAIVLMFVIASIYTSNAHASGLAIAPSAISYYQMLAPQAGTAAPKPAPAPVPTPKYTYTTGKLAGLDVGIWAPVAASGKLPLVIFSHGFNGCNTQSLFLTQGLAESGYLVIAPNHKDAVCGNGVYNVPQESFKNPELWTDQTYVDRKMDIQNLLLELQINSSWNSMIDWNKVALAGHSLGGYTVLGVAGAWRSWKTGGIKAVLALSPVCSPYTANPAGNLGGINAAIMYQGGTKDMGVTPYIKKPGGCYDRSPSPTYFVEFDGAGHYAFTNAVLTYQKDINYYSVAFLNAYVKNDPAAYKLLQKRLASVTDYRAK